MTNIDWDRLQPLRVTTGPSKGKDGQGCAMEVVSWINGDKTITDLPECSDACLAQMVQRINDNIGLSEDSDLVCPSFPLSPEAALYVVELGLLTVGTQGMDSEKLAPLHAELDSCWIEAISRRNTAFDDGAPLPFQRDRWHQAHIDRMKELRTEMGLDTPSTPSNMAELILNK